MDDVKQPEPIKTRDAKGHFLKGMVHNGGRGGRPKTPQEFKDLAKSKTVEALLTLVKIMENEKALDKDRIAAAKEILDRGYGKSTQYVEAETDNTIRIIMDDKLKEFAQ